MKAVWAAPLRLGLDANALADMAHWLLARRSLARSDERAHPDELAYYFDFGPAFSSLEQIAQMADACWKVEQDFELAKQEAGLGEYGVRHWSNWYREINLVIFALAYLTVVRQHARVPRKRAVPTG